MAFIGGIYGIDKQVIDTRGSALLDETIYWIGADELIEAYSHGMKQRLVLSAARFFISHHS